MHATMCMHMHMQACVRAHTQIFVVVICF